ncbi:MAG: hypothetical protein GY862_26810, partial [Gammaproteobacteria bacterium]|nr:hypothetical protein [Gammaproteobacteria bacterium]
WGKGAAENDLLRIRLLDADRLAEFLGVERAGNKAARLKREIEPRLTFPQYGLIWRCHRNV